MRIQEGGHIVCVHVCVCVRVCERGKEKQEIRNRFKTVLNAGH